jgi:hypothetical protein
MATSSPHDLKWLNKFESITWVEDGQEEKKYDVEDFEAFRMDDKTAIRNIELFMDSHLPEEGLDMKELLLKDIAEPVEFSLRLGVQEINKSEKLTKLRCKKACFIITQVLPRMYKHVNFRSTQRIIPRILTEILALIAELYNLNPPNKNDGLKMQNFFKAKEFLSNVAFQIWATCFQDQGITLVEDHTLPCLRRLAMLDLLDPEWSYAGGWESALTMLDVKHNKVHLRIPADKAINETTEMIRQARKSMNRQAMAIACILDDGGDAFELPYSSTLTMDVISHFGSQTFRYYPKCSAYMCSEIETPEKPHQIRCFRCHYYHWCSTACQNYSENIACNHQHYCGNLPDEILRQCRRETEEYLNIQYGDEFGEENIKCHACGLHKRLCKDMPHCSKCKSAHYCSRMCQVWDWERGGHRTKCIKVQEEKANAANARQLIAAAKSAKDATGNLDIAERNAPTRGSSSKPQRKASSRVD